MNRALGIKRLKYILDNLLEDTSQWPKVTMMVNECGCILQQVAGDECIEEHIRIGKYKVAIPYLLGEIIGLKRIESERIAHAYDAKNKIELTHLIGELV